MGSLLDERLQYSQHEGQSNAEEEFLGAIFVTDPRDDRSALVHRKSPRAEGTCAWITKTVEFIDWMSSTATSPGLIVEGGPGKGKSMIAIYLTECLEQLMQTSEANTESVIYFFCDNRNPKQNNALAVIRCLVWQLCQLRPHLLHHGVKEAKARGDAKHLVEQPDAAVETLWRILISMINDDRAGTVSCVIDGLDECDEASILSILTKFHGFMAGLETSKRNFKFIILSRPLSSRCRPPQLRTLAIPKIELDPDLNKDDIAIFIDKRVDELAESSDRPWRGSLRRKVKETLLKKAGGTFLWVGFVADDLRGKSAFEVTSCLRTLPLGLHGVYDRILLGMPEVHRFKIRSILHWICLAHHPLSKPALAGLVHVEEGIDSNIPLCSRSRMPPILESGSESDRDTSDKDLYSDLDMLEGLLEYCKPIIKLADDNTIHFVHQSVKDYLMRTDNIIDPNIGYFVVGDIQYGNERLGLRCIDCILEHAEARRELRGSIAYDDDVHYYIHRAVAECTRPCLKYASANWVHHIQSSGEEYQNSTTTGKVLQLIDEEGEMRASWRSESIFPFRDLPTWGFYNERSQMSTLALAIVLGLGPTVRQLLLSMSIGDYVFAMRHDIYLYSKYASFLGIAIKHQQPHIVKVILDRYGSEVLLNDPGSLITAVSEADHRSLQLLLALPPGPQEVHGENLNNALATVINSNSSDWAPLGIKLIQAGANPEAGLALLATLARTGESDSEFKLAESFFQSGMDPAKKLDYGYTLLHEAARVHNVRMASLLIQWGAPLDAVNFMGSTPLHLAAVKTDDDRVRDILSILITAGRATEPQDCSDGSMPGSWHIDLTDSNGQSTLHLAADYLGTTAVEVLLQSGASPHLKNNMGKTPLTLLFTSHTDGIWSSVHEVVLEIAPRWINCIRLLVDAGAAGNEQDAQGRTVLHGLAQLMRENFTSIRHQLDSTTDGAMPRGTTRAEMRHRLRDLELGLAKARCKESYFVQALDIVRRMDIDKGLKDASGKTAWDHYPVENFWRTIRQPGDTDFGEIAIALGKMRELLW
jgi:hypothetical protein